MKDRWVLVTTPSTGRSCSRYSEHCEWPVVEYNEKVFILLVLSHLSTSKAPVFITKKETICWEGWVPFMD